MYKVIYTPNAKKDIEEVFNYIANTLNNKTAANKLLKKMKKEETNIKLFPYANPQYLTQSKLELNYRRGMVDNYSFFYTIDEERKKIIVSRIIYSKREIEKVLN